MLTKPSMARDRASHQHRLESHPEREPWVILWSDPAYATIHSRHFYPYRNHRRERDASVSGKDPALHDSIVAYCPSHCSPARELRNLPGRSGWSFCSIAILSIPAVESVVTTRGEKSRAIPFGQDFPGGHLPGVSAWSGRQVLDRLCHLPSLVSVFWAR